MSSLVNQLGLTDQEFDPHNIIPGEMVDVVVAEVSFVDKTANRRRWLIAKQVFGEDDIMPDTIQTSTVEVLPGNPQEDAVVAALSKAFAGVIADRFEAVTDQLEALFELVTGVTQGVQKTAAGVDPSTEKEPATPAMTQEQVQEAVNKAVAAAVSPLQTQIQEIAAALAKPAERRGTLAKAEETETGGEPDDTRQALHKRLRKLTPDEVRSELRSRLQQLAQA